MNYVFIFPDELRAESIACYGHPLVKTPNIDRLAEEGTLFEQNYTAHPVCGTSRATIASGWYPHVDARRSFYMPKDTDPNMFKPLKESGFTIAHVGKDDMFDHASMKRLFDEYPTFHRRSAMTPQTAIPEARYSMLYPPLPDDQEKNLSDSLHNEQAIDFINRHAKDEKPFFLMVSYLFPHPPYGGIEKYYNMYDPEDIPELRGLEWMKGKPEFYPILREYREMVDKNPQIYKKMNAVYLGMITFIDKLVGDIVASLKANGIYDDTTIIFCSDHGDYAGDAGQLEKWPSDMSDMITRVPLIIRRPGCPGGHRVNTPTQSIDIMPTVLDYENVELDYLQFGHSLKAQIEGAEGDAGRAVYTEGGYDTHEPWCFEPLCFKGTYLDRSQIEGTDYYPKSLQQQEIPDSVCRVIMQRYGEWKLNYRTNGQCELYNMKLDPQEYNNLYGKPEYEQIQNELILRMLTWLTHTSDVTSIDGRV